MTPNTTAQGNFAFADRPVSGLVGAARVVKPRSSGSYALTSRHSIPASPVGATRGESWPITSIRAYQAWMRGREVPL